MQADLAAQLPTSKVTDFPASNWEDFHATHYSAKFFRERRYMPLAFPELLQPNAHILEIGAGAGASIVPILKVLRPACMCGIHRVTAPALFSLSLIHI